MTVRHTLRTMARRRNRYDRVSEWGMSAFMAVFGLFAVANLLYAAKSMMGIDLFPGHAGELFAAGKAMAGSRPG